MTCPHCGRQHDGYELSPGAISVACPPGQCRADRPVKEAKPAKPAKAPKEGVD